MTEPTGLALLRQPFPPHQISKLPKPAAKREVMDGLPKATCNVCGGYHATSKIIHLDYVGHAALTDRLLDADPNWTWEPLAINKESGLPVIDDMGGLWIRLTVCGVTRLGYGDAGEKSGPNAIKEAIGDALRNAAMRFGAALDLWHKGDLHKDEDEPKSQGAAQNGTEANRQALGGLQPETQDALRRAVPAIVAAAKDNPTQAKFLAESTTAEIEHDDPNIIRMALWALLDSKTRAAIKAAK